MDKITGFFKGLNKKQIIIICTVTVLVLAVVIAGAAMLFGGNKKVAQEVKILKVTSARLAETDPVKVTVCFTYKNGRLDSVRFDDTYNNEDKFEEDLARYNQDTEKVANVVSVNRTHTISYDVKDLSKWKDKSFEQLEKEYQQDMSWNIIVQEAEEESSGK